MLGAHADTIQAPDMVEPLIGWRTWSTRINYDRQVLVSPDKETVWPHRPGQFLQAQCDHDQSGRAGCHCGVNAFQTSELLAKSGYCGQAVWGQVKLWGEVNTYKDGLRGECAAPGELFVNPDLADAEAIAVGLARTYGVPVSVKAMPGATAVGVLADPTRLDAIRDVAALIGGATGLVAVLGWTHSLIDQARGADLSMPGTVGPSMVEQMLVGIGIPGVAAALAFPLAMHRRRIRASVVAALCLMTIVGMIGSAAYTAYAEEANGYMDRQDTAWTKASMGEVGILRVSDETRVGWVSEHGRIPNGECDARGRIAYQVHVCRLEDVAVYVPDTPGVNPLAEAHGVLQADEARSQTAGSNLAKERG